MRFPYSTTDPSQDVFDSLPRLPLRLRADSRAVDAVGLVDSGATVDVSPYEMGLQLGIVWDDRRANIRLAGTLGQQPAMPVFMIAEIADFAPVRLAFAWVQGPNAPLILVQTNFFEEAMMTTVTTEEFHQRIHDNHMYGLWELASQMTAHPMPQMRAWMWKWWLLDSVIKQSGEVIPVGEERRALQLFNPGMGGQWATTNTLIAAIQLLQPGEVARAHRHTPTAIRFILEGSGAYTAVEGERVYMEPGDLVLTPNWQWHDHGNETDHPVVWMDGLDIPLVRSLNTMFFQMYTERQVPATKPVNASKELYGHGRLSPTWVRERPQSSPLLLYSWDQTEQALQALKDHEGSPYEGIALEYTHPRTGGPCLPTMGCHVQLIRPGEHLHARRTTGSAVFCVVQGQGFTVIDGEQFVWSKGDVLALPSWALCEHANTASEDAVLFSIRDQPVMEALGFYREEVLEENGGHQEVVGVFSPE